MKLKFNLISPDKRNIYRADLDKMFSLLENEYGEQAKDSYDHDLTYYLLCSNDTLGVIGGVRLIPLTERAQTTKFFSSDSSNNNIKTWEVSRIFFSLNIDWDNEDSEKLFDRFCYGFYQGLFESLKTVSIAMKLDKLITVLPAGEHQDMVYFGLWPMKEIATIASPYDGDPRDVFIVARMPLEDSVYQLFQERCSSYASCLVSLWGDDYILEAEQLPAKEGETHLV
jgi:N-acyl-L-homoserine lactone synthetase